MKTAISLLREIKDAEYDPTMTNTGSSEYQYKLLTDWKEDVCKKQREICTYEIEEESDSNLGETISAIKNIVLNAPEPT